MLTYAIGDIHGHLEKLQALHHLIAEDRRAEGTPDAPVIHIGDLVDRGPDSKGVIDFLIAGQARGEAWITLRGNHDRMFRGFLDDPDHHDPRLRTDLSWVHERLGGGTTLASYGVRGVGERFLHDLQADARAAVPQAHIDFLDGLANFHVAGDCLYVHAGIRPGVELAAQSEDDLLWIRKEFLEDERDHGPLIVHGHTPVDRVTHYGNRLNLDTGAGYGDPMSAVVIEGTRVWQLTARGRVAVEPARR